MRNIFRRGRGTNPFEANTPSGQPAPAGPDGTVQASEAATAVLGPELANHLATSVAADPVLQTVVSATLSAVGPNDIDEDTVSIYSIVLDTSYSAARLLPSIAQGHDEFLDALKPALREGIAILVTCTLLDGTVVYPLTKLQDAPRFGRRPMYGERAMENGLSYDHINSLWARNLIDNTPLRDRVKEQITVLLGEMVKWAAQAARTVNLISAAITDGLDTSSKTTPDELGGLTGATEEEGYFTALATFIGDLKDPKFRPELEHNIIGNLMPQEERYNLRDPKARKAKYGHLLPEGHERMDNEQLLRWWFYRQGLAAEKDRLFPTGADPKEIRRAAGQMSMTAYQQSGAAYAGSDDEETDGANTGTPTSGWPSLPPSQ